MPSIFDIFTEMQLRMTSDFITGREKLIREAAEKMGLDPDEAWADAQKPKVEMTCPACGQPATMTLNCRGCGGAAFSDYADDEINQARQHILDLPVGTPKARQHAALKAFNVGGCMVCPNCIEQTLTNDRICPLLWILCPQIGISYLAVLKAQGQDSTKELQRIVDLWCITLADGNVRQWRQHLFNHALPNAIQAWCHWRESFINQHKQT